MRHCIVRVHHCFDSSLEAFAVFDRVREIPSISGLNAASYRSFCNRDSLIFPNLEHAARSRMCSCTYAAPNALVIDVFAVGVD